MTNASLLEMVCYDHLCAVFLRRARNNRIQSAEGKTPTAQVVSISDWSAIMNMKDHILTALREQFNEWEKLLATISEEQRTTRQHPSKLSTKDIVAHAY